VEYLAEWAQAWEERLAPKDRQKFKNQRKSPKKIVKMAPEAFLHPPSRSDRALARFL
jgi:hypothetical protein